MNLPFQLRKTFTTTHSQEVIIEFIQERLSRKSKVLFITWSEYIGSITGKSFNFYKNFNVRRGPSNPKISGTITAINPTTIDIKISPHYFRVLLFLICPIVFVPVAILNSQMTINGVLRAPYIYERIVLGLIGSGIPIIWCYFDSIRPIKKAELWLKEALGLKEIIQ